MADFAELPNLRRVQGLFRKEKLKHNVCKSVNLSRHCLLASCLVRDCKEMHITTLDYGTFDATLSPGYSTGPINALFNAD